MQTMDDMALLREYAARNSEAAFAELVSRRVSFVYAAALRQVRDPHLAEEITQAVFVILAQKAGRISEPTILAGWLFKTTRFAAIAQTRTAAKRALRRATIEKELQMQKELPSAAPNPLWEKMSPLLDEALAALGETDRQAVLLRFFENKSLAEVGSQLGTGEDTARKRVARALEKMHRYFSRRGVSSTTAILAEELSANSVPAAPVALAKMVTAVALAKGAAASGSSLTLIQEALKIMAWTKAKSAGIAGLIVLLAAGTTTVTVNHLKRQAADEAWRVRPFNSRILERTSPQVKILPAKTSRSGGYGIANDKRMGTCVDAETILRMAYEFWSPTRTIVTSELPKDKYDFIACLPSGNTASLRQEIKNQFGLTARTVKVETNVLLLKVKIPNAPGLHPSKTRNGESQGSGPNFFKCKNQSVSGVAGFVENVLEIPVINKTALTQHFDLDLNWSRNDPQHESLKLTLLDQLGLELVPDRETIEMLVVEKVK